MFLENAQLLYFGRAEVGFDDLIFARFGRIVVSPEFCKTVMQTFHSLPMLVCGRCCSQMWRFMRVPRRGRRKTLFLPWGAPDRAAGKQKFTTKTFLLGYRYFFLETARGCSYICPHAQDSVVVHRVTPVDSPVLGLVVPQFSPSYPQCLPLLPN